MPVRTPPNAADVRKVVEERLAALKNFSGIQETVTVEWRGDQLHIPVISMPVELLHYNPDTHRIRAQRSINPALEQDLETEPYGASAQGYLHQLLKGDPTDPSQVDPSFIALREDLQEHGQSEPGIISRSGVLINGNTRRAALKDLGQNNIRVGVLPPDAGHEDIQSIELSLQLRKDHKRDYSFMNFLLAIDERVASGKLPAVIQDDFRIKATTFERSRWILDLVRDALDRSKVAGAHDKGLSLRLSDFETHQGKLEELYRSYIVLKRKSPDDAEALREQRLLALVLDKSKTDLRLIEPNFVKQYMPQHLPSAAPAPGRKIPGTTITSPGPSQEVQALRQLTTRALQAKSIQSASRDALPTDVANAADVLGKLNESMIKALDHAGKQVRIVKKQLAAAVRVSDACEDLALAIEAVANARSTNNFDAEDLEEALGSLRSNLEKLSAIIVRGSDSESEATTWLRAIGKLALAHR
jgi:ParB-like chromosome segregation protein Spo0J